MKKTLSVIITILALSTFAQKADYKKYFEEGSAFIDDGNYLAALNSFMKAYKVDSSSANINFQIGFCYLKHPSYKHLAEEYLERAIKGASKNYNGINPMEDKAPLEAYLWLGEAYHLDYKFDKAEEMLKTYEDKSNLSKKNKEEYEEIERLRRINRTARAQVAKPARIVIENLGDSLNSQYPDFSPVLSADERMMIFTYRGINSTGGIMTADGQYFEDIFVSYKNYNGTWTEAKSIGSFVNTVGHEASVSVTPDGQTLIIYKDDNGDGNLYYSTWNGNEWGMPTKFGDEINTKSWETHACFNLTKDVLYFVSDKPGGYGGRDIYRSKKLPNGQWGKAVNLGPTINTIYDEEAPFVHSNGTDFYFASQDHGTMGGFDIFKSSKVLGTDSFAKPEALPYPINTTDDDVFFVLSPDNKRAYYASSHEDAKGHGEKDIYRIYMPQPEESELIVFLGQFIPAACDELPQNIEITVYEKGMEEPFGVYRPHGGNGSFTMIMFPNKTYNFSYKMDDKEFMTDEITTKESQIYQEIKKEIPLKPIQLDPTNNQQLPCVQAKLVVKVFEDNISRKPIMNAEVLLTDKIGRKTVAYTKVNGELDTVMIRVNDQYTLNARERQNTTKTESFFTKDFKKDTLIIKELFIKVIDAVVTNTVTPTTNNEVIGAKPKNYKCYFKYNINEIPADDAEFTVFIENLKKYIDSKGKAKLKIVSSASQVPTKTFKTNERLAKSRANKSKEIINVALKKVGVNANKYKFIETKSEVAGPEYNKDRDANMTEYEKYQYVEVSVE